MSSPSPDVNRARFARFVARALRAAHDRGLTDREIEQATGIRASTFHRWRRAEVMPQMEKVEQFCRGLDMPIGEAIAALGFATSRRENTAEPPMDPDLKILLRKLADPNTNEPTKAYIRATLRYLASLPDVELEERPRRRRQRPGA